MLLDKQGRARPEIAALYSWRYKAEGQGSGQGEEGLGNLPAVEANGTGELPITTTSSTVTTRSTTDAMVVDGAATSVGVSMSAGVVSVSGGDVRYQRANAGFVHTFQFVDVGDFQGRGETQPTPYFYQVTSNENNDDDDDDDDGRTDDDSYLNNSLSMTYLLTIFFNDN